MDGVSTDIYERLPKLKSKNPNLKVMIALGGWTFNDPGTWQSVFPSLTSSSANRATFIKNLLGFLVSAWHCHASSPTKDLTQDQYGFDGVDFDWEYPGADDRGGTANNGVDFTSMLEELRTAIDANSRDYIVTFTAPTSYWYLRHFDITAMTKHVDWINLMAYDLHGVWDRDVFMLRCSLLCIFNLCSGSHWQSSFSPHQSY